ncbi:MAG: efflux RND transporter periplasmic adaptor subunit [Chloroflexi bacterium]|nr:efflux RND transporter periplasmic adaptor subunit [Chloroflexota bacterium]MBV9897439.1 efflux RND transporter periplasmic adaptor subunit [Chloroflexota bacterium]
MVLPRLRFVATAAVVSALATSACGPLAPVTTNAATTTQANTTTSTVRIGKAVRGDLTGVAAFTAQIQTKGQVAIIPSVSAALTKFDVDVGSKVRAGDTLAELDHADLDEQVLAAQAAQATAEAKLAELKAGPKPEVLAAAQANSNAAAARVKALQSARDNADISTLDQRVKDDQAALQAAQAAMQPDAQAVAQADAAVQAAQTKLNDIQSDPTKSKDQNAVNAAKSDLQKAQDAATKARQPTGSQAAVTQAQNELQVAQQEQLLARLSTTAFDLDEARALQDAAQAQLNLANAPASPEELQAAQAQVEEAFAQAELARARAKDATIVAPITGVVAEIKAQVGSTVGPSAAIMTLIPPDMQVVVQVDESQVSLLQVGQSANLTVDSFPRDAFGGTVKAIAPVLDPRTRTAAVQVDVPDPQGKLKPGMFAQMAIQLGQHQATLMVPSESVLKLGSPDPSAPPQLVVFTVTSGRVHRQPVTLGLSDGKNIEILQGLQEGTDVVLNPRPDFLEGELISAS